MEPVGSDLLLMQQQSSWAVVSFLFQDAVWCDWIYREFDGMRVPRPLLGRPSRHGTPYPERVSISPDPADPAQLESYAETLKTAQHLIIVVSPTSAQEDLLQEHMRIFRASGGEERIIALVVKGEPASPAAEPGSQHDREWLPSWLEYRFQNNRFEPGPSTEPLVIDARLGASSLAEVRAKLFAALLEVPVTQLSELGVVARATTADLARQASAAILKMPEPTPLPTLAALAVPEVEDTPGHSRWPVVLCSIAAVAALGCLAFWPTKNALAAKGPGLLPPPAPLPAKSQHEDANQPVTEVGPLVAVLPVPSAAPAEPKKANPAPAVPAVQSTPPVEAPVVAVTVQPPAPAPAPTATAPAPGPAQPGPSTPRATLPPSATATNTNPPAVNPGAAMVPSAEQEAAERKRFELASRRDRLVRLAETRGNAGEIEEALEAFQQAIEAAQQLVDSSNGGHDEVLEFALLYRRVGNFAASVNSAAEGRMYYERGRRALVALRAKGKLPREAVRILSDLEANAKPSRD